MGGLDLRRGFSEISTLNHGKAIHGVSMRKSFKLSLFQNNTLISMYAKFGKFEEAYHVLRAMPVRNEASWNTIISGYVQLGRYHEAMDLFSEMKRDGVKLINGFALASVLTACARSSQGKHGEMVHGCIVRGGLLADVFVSTALLHLYGSHGSILCARKVFEEMIERNVVSWTAMIVGYMNFGRPEEAIELYCQMRRKGCEANQNTFASVISSCWALGNEFLGAQVIGHVVKTGYEDNVSVGNALVTMFGNFGCIEDAERVFKWMPELDTISWTSMISVFVHDGLFDFSFECFKEMLNANMWPDSNTLSSLITACCSVENLKWGKGIHGYAMKIGLDSVIPICNTLIHMYTYSGCSGHSELVFHSMPKKDIITWNSMIGCYAHNNQCQYAFDLLSQMLWNGDEINHVTLTNALSACLSPDSLGKGKMLHTHVVHGGLQENVLIMNTLVTMYAKCDAMEEAVRVFGVIAKPDVVTWNAMVGGHADNEETEEAFKVFNLMRQGCSDMNYITMVNILASCSTSEDLMVHGMPLHARVIVYGFGSDEYVRNSLLMMYAKCGDLDSSAEIFNNLSNKSNVSWNAMIAANAHHGRGEESLKLFMQMLQAGYEIDHFSLSGCLAACASLAVIEEGQQVHALIVKQGFEANAHVLTAITDMYGKGGKLGDAERIFSETSSDKGRALWNTLISGYARHGYFEKAREAFQRMLKVGLKPDHVTFVALLSACNHVGLVDEGLSYFSLMTSNFGVPPGIEHCVCMVDLLGRSGRLIEAETFIMEMPISPNGLVWRSLLAACRTHGNLEMGKRAAKELLVLNPQDDSAYVLLSNIYAAKGKWKDVEKVRGSMNSIQVRKHPGCSWIKVKNKVSSFGMGDRTHPQIEEIYDKLMEIIEMIKEAGYVADTSFVLHDTDEEQKEHNLWNHSEKLALAFGLMNTPEESSLMVMKNLRVCGDCHTVYKFVSGITWREITLRDPYRFHHFKGGKCSCLDYW
ncbi:hypothetical protein AMTRI_Chr02g255880 [Amborella trichopoda]